MTICFLLILQLVKFISSILEHFLKVFIGNEIIFFIFPISDVPSVPKDLEVTEVTDDSVTLEWSPPVSNGGAPIIGYPIERKEPGRSQWIRVTRVEPDVTWHTIKNLLEGRGYVFRVFAENAEGLSEPAAIDKAAVPQRPLGKDINSCR